MQEEATQNGMKPVMKNYRGFILLYQKVRVLESTLELR